MKKLLKKHKIKLILLAILLLLNLVKNSGFVEQEQIAEGMLEIHCLDVGQGDSTLIIGENQVMLIDGAERNYSDEICQHLTNHGIKKIDYLVATHPHDDHIGGMADIMSQFSVGCLVLTEEYSEINAYQNMLSSAHDFQIPTLVPKVGDSIPFEDASCIVLGPVSLDRNNSNNNTMILKLQHGKNKFLFMGDAEKDQEKALAEQSFDLKADFLRVGHHGSDGSSQPFFLQEVQPEIAVISCGLNNKYNHPSPETITNLEVWCSEIYRTDLDETISFLSDGTPISRLLR